MEYFSKYAGKINKIGKRHEKGYIKSLFKGFAKDPFSPFDFRKQDKDVRRYESAEFRLANKRQERAFRRAEAKEAKAYNRENW